MRRQKKLFSLTFLYSIAFIPWSQVNLKTPDWPTHLTLRLATTKDCTDGNQYQAKTATTSEAHSKGLGGIHTPLNPQEGMLFIYDSPAPRTFWMKDTWISLSLLFFDSKGRLLSASEMKPEQDPSNPRALYSEQGPTLLALEVQPGIANKVNQDSRKHFFLCVEKSVKYNASPGL